MHDLVRSTARKIASEQRHVFAHQKTTVRVEEWPRIDELQKVTWVNVEDCDIHELPEGLVCPKLELFRCSLKTISAVKILNTFSEGMKQLKVLDFTEMHLPSLPSSLQCLANLQTLFTQRNSTVDSFKAVRLTGSAILKVIPPDVISSLFRLEDLCMENNFTQWDGEGKSNACLAELKHLSHLTSLDVQIPDAKLLPKDLVFDNLVRYRIFVGDVWSWEEIFEANSTLKLNKWGGFLKLKHLNVESSPEIQYIVNSMDLTPSHGAFPVMETLSVNQLINLQEVCRGQFPAGSFGCLRKVEVKDCDGLKFLFSLSMARCLSRLEEIKVTRCKSMVEMVSQGRKEIKEAAVNVPLFPELRSLTLEDLPKLSNFCFEENPVLSKPASTIVGPSTPPLNQPEIRDGQLLLSLGGNLRSLVLKNCMSLLKLFPPSLLQNLEELIVENCGQLEHVFDLEGLNVDDGHVELLPKLGKLTLIGNIIFPKLSHITLESLPNLTSFVSPPYHSLQRFHHADLDAPFPVLFDERFIRDTFVFPKIIMLALCNLPQLGSFYPGAHTSQWPLLEQLMVSDCHKLDVFAFKTPAFQQRHGCTSNFLFIGGYDISPSSTLSTATSITPTAFQCRKPARVSRNASLRPKKRVYYKKVVYDGGEFAVGDDVYVKRRENASSDDEELQVEELFETTALKEVPKGDWICHFCEARKLGKEVVLPKPPKGKRRKRTAREKLLSSDLWAAHIENMWKEVDGTYWFRRRWYIIPEEIALIVTFNLFTGKGLLKYIFNLENGEVKSQASIS
ncbi:Origin of replication complex subunit 1 [Vitis vinifera]|uniref:Origin of replication complex subunit 1 n=1 Tax=Vitis vinifera TaxID=29760 RepID=A0A438J9M9_VITVI|nr:Origin of replication complex subunit 1 [Vitis vinifera]